MRLCMAFGMALLAATGAMAQDTGFVIVDRSRASYWVVGRFPAEDRESIKAKIASGAQMEMIELSEFKANPERHVGPLVVKDEYPGWNLLKGVLAVLERYPRTPFGLTWTGGIALTSTDYQHTERIYQLFRNRPDEYERTKVSNDLRRDPIHPANHLARLLDPQKHAAETGRLTLILMEIESVNIRKQVCNERFPAYRQQNESAYRRFPYSLITSERMIESYAEPNDRIGLLRELARDRSSTTENFQRMDDGKFEKICAEFPQAIEKLVNPKSK